MNNLIRAIIFDFGGVIINWDPHVLFNKYFKSDTNAIDDFLTEIDFNNWNLAQDKGYPFALAVTDLSAQFPQYAHLIQAYDKEWEESITGIVPESAEILHKLKSAGSRLYGLTNWSSEKFSIVRRKYPIFNLFEEIIVSGEVKLIKPDPAIYHMLLHRINLKSNECLMVDDSLRNIEVARKLGFLTHHFTSPANLEVSLRQFGLL